MDNEKKAYLDDAAKKIIEEILVPMTHWTRKELEEAMEYCTSRPHGSRILDDVLENLSNLVVCLTGSDEELPEREMEDE